MVCLWKLAARSSVRVSRIYSGRCQRHVGILVRGGAPTCLEGAQSPGKPAGGRSWDCGPRRQPLPPSNAVPRSVPGVPAARPGRTQPAPSLCSAQPQAGLQGGGLWGEGCSVKGTNGAQVPGGRSRPLSPGAGARASGGNGQVPSHGSEGSYRRRALPPFTLVRLQGSCALRGRR